MKRLVLLAALASACFGQSVYPPSGGGGGGGGGTPGTPIQSVQFNDPLGTFAGNSGFIYNPAVLSAPGAPTVVAQGTTGASTCSYQIAAITAAQVGPISSATTITNCNATQTPTNKNHITWSAVTRASWYAIFDKDQKCIGITSALSIDDTGQMRMNEYSQTFPGAALSSALYHFNTPVVREYAPYLLDGTSTANAATSIVGVGSHFTAQVHVGDCLYFSSNPATGGLVISVTDDTHIDVAGKWCDATDAVSFGDGTTQTMFTYPALWSMSFDTGLHFQFADGADQKRVSFADFAGASRQEHKILSSGVPHQETTTVYAPMEMDVFYPAFSHSISASVSGGLVNNALEQWLDADGNAILLLDFKSHQVTIGQTVLPASSVGSGNILMGNATFADSVSNLASRNVLIGYNADQLESGSFNIAVGYQARNADPGENTGSDNIGIGSFSGGAYGSGTTGAYNVSVGASSLRLIGGGSHNVAFGDSACQAITDGGSNVCLGPSAGPTANQSNKLFIDISQTNTPLIGGDFSAHSLAFADSGGTSFASLTTTGSAGGKKVVCVDTATGRVYASSTTTGCDN